MVNLFFLAQPYRNLTARQDAFLNGLSCVGLYWNFVDFIWLIRGIVWGIIVLLAAVLYVQGTMAVMIFRWVRREHLSKRR